MGERKHFHRVKPEIDHAVIKKVWKRCLKRNGLWADVPDHVMPDCWIGYIPFANRNRVMHRLTYCSRRPIENLTVYLTPEVDDDGSVREPPSLDEITDGLDREFALFLLDYTPRVANMGFMHDLNRLGYSRKPNSPKCPICGGDMEIVRNEYGEVVLYGRPPPDVPVLQRNRKGIWRPAQSEVL